MLKRVLRKYGGLWRSVPQGPPDTVLGMTEAYAKIKSPRKVNLGIGVYRDDNEKPWVLPSVRQAELHISRNQANHEYLPIEGLESFCNSIIKSGLGNNLAVREDRLAWCQSLSGVGALRLGMEFLKKFYPKTSEIYISQQAWPNYANIIKDSGYSLKTYSYFDFETKGLDFERMCEDLEDAPRGSVIILEACGHNPTGVDPTKEQWQTLQKLMAEKQHIAYFDLIYNGLVSGDPFDDAYPVRLFADNNNPTLVSQSCAKNFGLYGDRVGCFYALCDSQQEKQRVQSQLKIIARPLHSNPPLHGARIVDTILNNSEIHNQWLQDLKTMTGRISSIRHELVEQLKVSPHDWSHISQHGGWFSYSGLNAQQCSQLSQRQNILITQDGRIALTGLNSKNVQYVAEAIDNVTKYSSKV